jgi:glucosamine-6-phosphate deaminase
LGCYAQVKDGFLNHVNIEVTNVHRPAQCADKNSIVEICREYESIIDALGGVDYQLLGIGRTGNIAFNEPGSQALSKTRLVMLDSVSRMDATKVFGGLDEVPISAISLGIGTILKSKKIVLLAWGEHKAQVLRHTAEGIVTEATPATFLQNHSNVKVIADLNAANELTRISRPWLVTSCDWDDKLIRKAIVWLCLRINKPILKLTDKDYAENSLSELLVKYGSAYDVNIRIFNDLQKTITGWPGGKPNADDSNRPERALPYPKTVLVFSPHPDDDVISMGGTLKRLIDQKHDVHVAYQTSGNIAVADEEVVRYLDFMKGFLQIFDSKNEMLENELENLSNVIEHKSKDSKSTITDVFQLKSLIRRCEALLACKYLGVHSQNVHFLNLPFYETGTIKKKPIGLEDVSLICDLIRTLQPHQIYVAADLGDPHGTHKVCLDAILAAVDELKDEEWMKNCRIWMYRGAWLEWEVDHIEMAVPLSPEELRTKRNAILRHHSQMEGAPFLGNDERLFWQRAEDRNHATANLYTQLGLASYEAIEAFVRYFPVE